MKTTTNTFKSISLCVAATVALSACSRNDDPVIPVTPPSDGTTLTLDGGEGGSAAENSVYVDLSAEQQTSVKRDSWSLGFYNGSEFRVILNSTNGSSAVAVDETDINAVSADDINIDDLTIPLGQPGAFDNIDDVTGDLDNTVIAEISATDAENKVYVVNPKGGSHADVISADQLYKVRILRAGEDYTLQYAPLNATAFETLTIQKEADYNFQFISFETGPVTVEPAKAEWDFQWTWSVYFGGMPNGATYPYGFSDLIFINHLAGVTAAEVIFEDENGDSTGKPTYEDFAEADLSGVSFSNNRNVIGSNWRATTGDGAGRKDDRFYLIKDAAGNIYKLRFISMGAGEDGGTRGYPELEYTLVKQG